MSDVAHARSFKLKNELVIVAIFVKFLKTLRKHVIFNQLGFSLNLSKFKQVGHQFGLKTPYFQNLTMLFSNLPRNRIISMSSKRQQGSV